MPKINRIVVGFNEDKQTAVIYRNTDDIQERAGTFWRSSLWAADELPVDNAIGTDRAEGVVARGPAGEGADLPRPPSSPATGC